MPLDPRIAGTKAVDSSDPSLIGQELVIVDPVRIAGELVHVPRPLAGVPEYVAAAEAEMRADDLLEQLKRALTDRGGGPRWVPDTTLVVEMRAAAEAVVISAAVGLEAFAADQVLRVADPSTGAITYENEKLTARDIRERWSLDQRYRTVLPVLLSLKNPAAKPWWSTFRRIQGLAALTRHAITEPVKRSGLQDERPLAERFYNGEYRGASAMMRMAFEHFAPSWISDERLIALSGDRAPGTTGQ
jgi:hypothetical protein